MHGTSVASPVVLSGMGGLVTLAGPDSVPEGASPRTYDTDFEVGSVKTRAGLTNPFVYATGTPIGPNPGTSAVETSGISIAWANPTNVLLDTGVYATASLLGGSYLGVESVTITSGGYYHPLAVVDVAFFGPGPGGATGTVVTASHPGAGGGAFKNVVSVTITNPGLYTGPVTAVFTTSVSGTATGDTVTAEFGAGSEAIDITGFTFNVPEANRPQGFRIAVKGYADAACTLNVQMLKAGVPVGSIESQTLNIGSPTTLTFGGVSDLFSTTWAYSDLNNTDFGVRVTVHSTVAAEAFIGYVTLSPYLLPAACNFQYVTTFTAQDGSVRNIFIDANGNFWYEDLTNNPGVLNLVTEGIAPNSLVTAINGPDVEYMTFCDGQSGSDMPLQYTSEWIDRITQVGPGAAPIFTAQTASSDVFDIDSIVQPVQASYGFSYYLQSSGPGSTAPGNVVTFYYSDSTVDVANADLVDAFNTGYPVYVYAEFSGTPGPFGPSVVQVTAIGEAQPPGQPRNFYYFSFIVPSVAFTYYQGSGHAGYTAIWQRSLATMTMVDPVPGLLVGNQVAIAGTSVVDYNNNWPIAQTLNSSQMAITQTSVSSGVATYTYSLTGGGTSPPAAGQLVTVTGTTNADGQLNVTDGTIVTASGGSSGNFTLNVSAPDASTAAESGQATTAGTIFAFDPGLPLLGTGTSPIYGTATGGTLTFGGASGQFIAPGTRQGTVIFITRNGYYTAPAPPVTFTCPTNTTAIAANQIPIGPPNVVARGILITEAGQNGVPGANFFTLPTQVQYIVNNVTLTASALFINDNVTTSAAFFFTDSVLLNGLAVDVYGYNLFNQIEIGDPGWVTNYASRNFYGLCRNKVQNFNNLSFDGGYLPAAKLAPLGWTNPDPYGSLLVSAKFGNSYYIENTTDTTIDTAGLIAQTAYQDPYQQPIINANTTYSVRVTAAIPSGNENGSLVVFLAASGIVYGAFTLPFSDMTSNYQTYTGTLLVNKLTTIPTALTLNVYAANLGAGADLEIDRVEVFPTAIPVLNTTVYGSYAGLPEQVDAVTGQVKFESENQQPVMGGVVMYDTLYGLKGWGGRAPGSSLYSLQASGNLEPAQWQEPEVAQRSGGAIGPLAFDLGEQWFLGASRAGLYLFEGGQPGKIMQEIYQVWDAINWRYGYTIWVKADIVKRKIFIGIPLPTPNFWLPNAPTNANPTSPNVILVCNYQGLDSGQELKSQPQMHTTMFGTLNAIDMRRKWTLWQIPAPYGNTVQGATDEEFYICNGIGNSKVYKLDDTAERDDGAIIDALYTTAGLVEMSKRAQMPGLGSNRLRWGYMNAALDSDGLVNVTLYPNKLLGPGDSTVGYNSWMVPGGFAPGSPALNDVEAPLNFAATRTYFEFRENDGHTFNLSNLALQTKSDTWNRVRGRK